MASDNSSFRDFLGSGGSWAIIVVLVATVLTIAVSYDSWSWLNSDEEAPSATIRNIGVIVGGFVAVGLTIWRSTIAEKQAETARIQSDLTQRGFLNERYQKGAEMLGSSTLSVRMAGIYALERLALDHPDLYHVQIMQLLCSFARTPTGTEKIPEYITTGYGDKEGNPRVREDVQAVITAIGRRSMGSIQHEESAKFRLNLRGVDLREADLGDLNLSGAVLVNANLTDVRAFDADLSNTDLQLCKMGRSRLRDANLSGAIALKVDLTGTFATGTDFSKAALGAILVDADLSGANLTGSRIARSDFARALLNNANLSGASFVHDLDALQRPPEEWNKYVARITQAQLDVAIADPDNPPTLVSGQRDAETGDVLVWRGCSLREEESKDT